MPRRFWFGEDAKWKGKQKKKMQRATRMEGRCRGGVLDAQPGRGSGSLRGARTRWAPSSGMIYHQEAWPGPLGLP